MSESSDKGLPLTAEAVYEAARNLSDVERDKLNLMLEQSGDHFDKRFATPEIAQAWNAEIRRRIALLREGKMQTAAADVVHQRLRAGLDNLHK